jgi:hypothetical protein
MGSVAIGVCYRQHQNICGFVNKLSQSADLTRESDGFHNGASSDASLGGG